MNITHEEIVAIATKAFDSFPVPLDEDDVSKKDAFITGFLEGILWVDKTREDLESEIFLGKEKEVLT